MNVICKSEIFKSRCIQIIARTVYWPSCLESSVNEEANLTGGHESKSLAWLKRDGFVQTVSASLKLRGPEEICFSWLAFLQTVVIEKALSKSGMRWALGRLDGDAQTAGSQCWGGQVLKCVLLIMPIKLSPDTDICGALSAEIFLGFWCIAHWLRVNNTQHASQAVFTRSCICVLGCKQTQIFV